MAENNIKIKVGSTFDGEGFSKANQAIKESSKELNSAKRGLGELTNAIGSVSPAAGTATSAVKSFVAAFTAGGIVGGAIELAIKGISLAVEKFNEAAEKAKQRAESFADAMREKLSASIANVSEELKKVKGEISETDKEINDLVSDLKAHSANEIRIEIAKVRADMWEKLNQAEDEQSKELIRAQADHTVEELKAKEAVASATIDRNACRDRFNKAVQEEVAAHELSAAAASKLSEVQSKYESIILERNYLQGVLKDLEKQEAEDGYLSQSKRQARISITNRLANLEKDHAEELAILNSAEEANRAAIEADTKAYEKKEAAHEALDQATEKLTAQQIEFSNKLKEIADKADHDYDGFHNEGTGAPDAEGNGAKSTLEKIEENTEKTASSVETNIEKDIEEIKNKKLEFSANQSMTVKFGDDARNIIPSPEEIKKAREATEKAPENTVRNLESKWSSWGTAFVRMINEGRYDEAVASGQFKDLFSVLDTLPPEIEAKFWQNSASHILQKSEWKEYFNDTHRLLEDILKRRDGENDKKSNQNTADTSSSDTSSSDTPSSDSAGSDENGGIDLSNIEDAIKEIGEKLTNCLTLQ